MSCIYCLYSSKDGEPKYVGKTSRYSDIRFREHLRAAELGDRRPVYCWIRRTWLAGHEVEYRDIEESIENLLLDRRERFWVRQMPELMNELLSRRETANENRISTN